ncbi:hypothetical protein G6F36_014027 [Rhizopus arrhizus]|nr:hypothetical protein G6F36_014027 [Rhizopus arrhizus]
MLEAPSPSNENLHLQLCVNDLLYPTEKSETLLEALTATQLEKIEKTISKIKTKKQFFSKQTATPVPAATTTANPMLLQHDWALIAAQIAKALTDTISSAAQSTKLKSPKPQSPAATGTASDKSPSQSTPSITSTTDTIDTTTDDTNSSISTPCSSATLCLFSS